MLFSAPMVRAIGDDSKRRTRRIVKPQPELYARSDEKFSNYHWSSRAAQSMVDLGEMRCMGPYGWKRDRLWVRETWRTHGGREYEYQKDRNAVIYAADSFAPERRPNGERWRPSIFMPRWASRYTLEIEDVRVERLHDITEEEAMLEGVRPFLETYDKFSPDQKIDGDRVDEKPYRTAFVCLWDEINGDRALFSSNPWVWVIAFRRIVDPS